MEMEVIASTTTSNDIKPKSIPAQIDRGKLSEIDTLFDIEQVCALAGMSVTYAKGVVQGKKILGVHDVIRILDDDYFAETFVPRSKILPYLLAQEKTSKSANAANLAATVEGLLIHGDAHQLVRNLAPKSIQCIVTSPPYWGMRLYEVSWPIAWADGELCAYGMEQTPEGYIRHTVELLYYLKPCLKDDGSVWWNVMDTFNTRTQIRTNAAEALRAMQGKETRSWSEYEARRYSAGHVYLKDGEQCTIPFRIMERASKIGYYAKSVISWNKSSSMPEPQSSRVSRNIEYVLHLSTTRTPKFYKEAYKELPEILGGRNKNSEPDKLADFWNLPTSSGRDGHGAQFALALPGRCIGLSTERGDAVLDLFVGAGTSAIAAKMLNRNFIGFDISSEYLKIAQKKIDKLATNQPAISRQEPQVLGEYVQGNLL